MPLPSGTRYRYKKGTKIRLAFAKGSNRVIEVKKMGHKAHKLHGKMTHIPGKHPYA